MTPLRHGKRFFGRPISGRMLLCACALAFAAGVYVVPGAHSSASPPAPSAPPTTLADVAAEPGAKSDAFVGYALPQGAIHAPFRLTGDAPPNPTPPYINAQDYGATPSLHHGDAKVVAALPDSTAAIQRALDAGVGGTVFLARGVYRVTAPLTMKAGTTLMGDGMGGTILTTEKPIEAVVHVKTVAGPMTTIRDLYFAGPVGGNPTTDGILLEHCNGVTVRDCWFGGWRRALTLEGVSDEWIRNVIYEFNKEGIFVSEGGLGRFSGNLRLFDVYGYHNNDGIHIENVRGVQIDNCAATGNAYCLWLKGCSNVTVSGATINWDASPLGRIGMLLADCALVSVRGCNVAGQSDSGITAVNCRLLTLDDNLVSNIRSGPGILLEGCQSSALSGNVISQTASHGLHLHGCTEVAASQNVIEQYGAGAKADLAAATHGLLSDGGSKECTVTDNIVTPQKGAGSAVEVEKP